MQQRTTPTPDMRGLLTQLKERSPHRVFFHLKEGDVVPKSVGSAYKIDNAGLEGIKSLFSEGPFPIGPIFNHFSPDNSAFSKLWSSSNPSLKPRESHISVVDFSKVIAARLGECLEMAIAAQIVGQIRGIEIALVRGGSFSLVKRTLISMHLTLFGGWQSSPFS